MEHFSFKTIEKLLGLAFPVLFHFQIRKEMEKQRKFNIIHSERQKRQQDLFSLF